MLLHALGLPLRRGERPAIAFVVGSACLSLCLFVLAALGLAWPALFLVLGSVSVAGGLWSYRRNQVGEPLPSIPVIWRWLLLIGYAVFGCIYLLHAMAPEISADGSHYRLGWVVRALDAHGFYPAGTDMYANLSQGAELLYLFAFALGKHSAAAMVHFGFLLVLPWTMVCYGRRFGFAGPGAAAALLVWLSPIVGYDGSSAYVDVAVACVAFVMFYLLRIWVAERTQALLIPVGLLAGFCYGMKYTAAVAVPYALITVAWHSFRKRERMLMPLAVTAGCALLMVAPWLAKNWLSTGNPVAPFFNSIFPNPYFHISQELEYREGLAHFNGVRGPLQIFLEVTVRGQKLGGLLGPVFLLAPVALLAFRRREGAALLAAACAFALPYPTNIGTRFLIPMLPFLSLAMAMVLELWRPLAVAVLVAHGLLSWPEWINKYSAPDALRLGIVPARAAFRIEPENEYLERTLGEYPVSRMLDDKVPPNAKVFTFSDLPRAYTHRTVLVSYQGALNNVMKLVLWTPLMEGFQPKHRREFRFPPARVAGVRVVLTAGLPKTEWSATDMYVLSGGRRLSGRWRPIASPNPWEAELAFDGSYATHWRTWQNAAPGMNLGVEFGGAEIVDAAVLECPEFDYHSRLRLEGLTAGGGWVPLAENPQESEMSAPDLRSSATAAVRRMGVDYILLRDGDYITVDVNSDPGRWGLRQVGKHQDWVLYRIQ